MLFRKAAGPVTRERVHVRTQQLALRAGRVPPEVAQSDYEQAKLEVTGETDVDRQNEVLDSLPVTFFAPQAVRSPISSPT